MAFVDNTTYTGKDAAGFYAKALLTGNTKSMIKQYANVKNMIKIARYDESGILQEADCTFTDGGTGTLSQKTLTVCPIKVNREFCKTTFEANYLSEQLRAGANGEEVMPMSFEEFFLEQVAKNISADLENVIWQGDVDGSPTPSVCDGFLKKFDADVNVLTVSGTTLNATTIIAELTKVYDKIPSTIFDSQELVIFVNHKAAKAYMQAQATVATANGSYFVGKKELDFLGIPVVIAPGLPDNVMVAAEKTNLWFGTDLASDFDDVKIIPQANITGAPTVRFVARFQFGVQYGVSEEIVYYS